jgi:GxxExxY protein
MVELLYKEDSYIIRGVCFELYKEIGCNHKEVIYHRGLEEKFKNTDLKIDTEKQFPVIVNQKKVGAYIPDLVINDAIILEIKAKESITRQDIQQF